MKLNEYVYYINSTPMQAFPGGFFRIRSLHGT